MGTLFSAMLAKTLSMAVKSNFFKKINGQFVGKEKNFEKIMNFFPPPPCHYFQLKVAEPLWDFKVAFDQEDD